MCDDLPPKHSGLPINYGHNLSNCYWIPRLLSCAAPPNIFSTTFIILSFFNFVSSGGKLPTSSIPLFPVEWTVRIQEGYRTSYAKALCNFDQCEYRQNVATKQDTTDVGKWNGCVWMHRIFEPANWICIWLSIDTPLDAGSVTLSLEWTRLRFDVFAYWWIRSGGYEGTQTRC